MGLKVRIHTDHKPLVPLFNDISLQKLPIRVQRFRLRMVRYSYIVEYIPGKENVVADALSRSTASPEKVDELLQMRSSPMRNSQLISVLLLSV